MYNKVSAVMNMITNSYLKRFWNKALYRDIRKLKSQTRFPSKDNDLLHQKATNYGEELAKEINGKHKFLK
jgi:hypothetical protein